MRRLAGHRFSSECCFINEIDEKQQSSPLLSPGYVPIASAADDYYWYLRDDPEQYDEHDKGWTDCFGCEFCELEQEFKAELLTIDKIL